MKVSPAEINAEIDGWMFGVQRSMLHHRMEWQFAMVVAGIYSTPNIFINPQ